MERSSDTVIRTEEGTTVLFSFLSGFLENRAARSVLAFFCSKIHRVSVRRCRCIVELILRVKFSFLRRPRKKFNNENFPIYSIFMSHATM